MKRELLFSITKKDLQITWFSGTGGGGQHRNKHQNCCRIKHLESGALVTGQEERSRKQNLQKAFRRLVEHPTFKNYIKIKASNVIVGKDRSQRKLQQMVDGAMKPENLRIECF